MDDRSEGPGKASSSKLTSTTPSSRGKLAKPASKPVSDTPQSSANVADASEELTKLGPKIARAMNLEFFTCDLNPFIRHYLPECDQKTLKQVRDCLIAKGHMSARPDEPNVFRFTKFNEKPSERKRRYDKETTAAKQAGLPLPELVDEKTIFNPLEDITDSIIVCLDNSQQRARLSLQMCPDARLEVDVYSGNQRIDAAISQEKLPVVDGKIKGKLSVKEIVIPLEFKISLKEEKLNHLQLASHVNFTMDADPRRNFVIGITIEDDQASLWYFSRSHSVKSSSFSIIGQPDMFIALMISLLCAPLSDLGFDPHVTLHADRKSYVYEFPNEDPTKSRFFKTLATIDERRDLRLTGRCTRVWKVMEIASRDGTERKDSSAPDMVLKDVWLDASAKTEKQIQDELFKDIRQFASTPGGWKACRRVKDFSDVDKEEFSSALEGENFKEYFLCISDSHEGDPCKIVAPGANRDNNVFATDPVDDDVFGSERLSQFQEAPPIPPEAASAEDEVGEDEEGSAEETKLDVFPHREFVSKRRCFSLSDLLCTALHDLETLGEAFDVLRRAATALLLMFCAGWVHRDVSSGNILAYRSKPDDAWQGKLHDLEYAKRFDPFGGGSSDSKIGTPYFMPLEILQGYYLQTETSSRVHDVIPEEISNRKPGRAVVHNHGHDFECLWWICLWLVTRRVKDKPHDAYKSVFSNSLQATTARIGFFTTGVPDIFDQLHSSLMCLATPLGFVRKQLHSEYVTINATDFLPSDSIEEIASRYSYVVTRPFSLFFRDIEKIRSKWERIRLMPVSANPKTQSRPLPVKPSEVVTKTRTARKRKSAQAVEEPGVGGGSQHEGSRTKKRRPGLSLD